MCGSRDQTWCEGGRKTHSSVRSEQAQQTNGTWRRLKQSTSDDRSDDRPKAVILQVLLGKVASDFSPVMMSDDVSLRPSLSVRNELTLKCSDTVCQHNKNQLGLKTSLPIACFRDGHLGGRDSGPNSYRAKPGARERDYTGKERAVGLSHVWIYPWFLWIANVDSLISDAAVVDAPASRE